MSDQEREVTTEQQHDKACMIRKKKKKRRSNSKILEEKLGCSTLGERFSKNKLGKNLGSPAYCESDISSGGAAATRRSENSFKNAVDYGYARQCFDGLA